MFGMQSVGRHTQCMSIQCHICLCFRNSGRTHHDGCLQAQRCLNHYFIACLRMEVPIMSYGVQYSVSTEFSLSVLTLILLLTLRISTVKITE
jgi:hypothetical protein